MANWSHFHFVSLRCALGSVSSNPEPFLHKLSASVAVEADVEPAVVNSLCDTKLLTKLDLNLSEQETVLKAIQFALKEKIDHICKGPPPSDVALFNINSAILKLLCNSVVDLHYKFSAEARSFGTFHQLHVQQVQCENVLCDVQKQLAAERCQQEQQPLLSNVVHPAATIGSRHDKLE